MTVGARSFVAGAAAVGMMVAMTACGQKTESADAGASASGESASGSSASQARLADSLQSLIEQTLEQERKDPTAAPEQIAILERAAQTGKISASDYESAWSDYRQCMVDKGDPEPVLWHYPNGMYTQAPVGGDDKKSDAFLRDYQECHNRYVVAVNTVYGVQQGNPSLYADPSEAIVDCLKREGLAPKSYTAEDFSHEQAEGKYRSFDVHDEKVRACMVANGMVTFDATSPADKGRTQIVE